MRVRWFETGVITGTACVVLCVIVGFSVALGSKILEFLPLSAAASLVIGAALYAMLRLSAGRELRPGDMAETRGGYVVTVEFIRGPDYVGIRDRGKLRIVGLAALRRLL